MKYLMPLRCYCVRRKDEAGRYRWKAASLDASVVVMDGANPDHAIELLRKQLATHAASKTQYYAGERLTGISVELVVAERLFIEPLGRSSWWRRWLIYTFGGWLVRFAGADLRRDECDLFDLVLTFTTDPANRTCEVVCSRRLDQYGAAAFIKSTLESVDLSTQLNPG